MPGWTITDWAAGADWSALDTINEFVLALNQRSLVIGGAAILDEVVKSKAGTCTVVGTALTATAGVFSALYVNHPITIADIGTFTVAAYTSPTQVTLSADGTCESKAFIVDGTDIQAATWLATFQDFVLDNYGSFVKSHDAGVKRDRDWFGDSDQNETVAPGTLFPYQSLADLFAAAGLETETFRRYTTHPDDAGVDLEGVIQAGDIIGHWLFEDLMKVYNALVWTPGVVSWISGGVNNEAYGQSAAEVAWNTAITGAHNDWGNESESDGVSPYAYTAGTKVAGAYTAKTARGISKGQATVYNGLTRDITWYVRCVAPYLHDWITQDDIGILDGKWSDWRLDEPATDDPTVVSGAYLGASLSEPAYWYGAPLGDWRYYGWLVSDEYAVVHWDRAGGLSSY